MQRNDTKNEEKKIKSNREKFEIDNVYIYIGK